MTEPSDPPFTAEVITAVARHMNADHGDDCLRICRALGGVPTARQAVMVGMDATGIEFSVAFEDAGAAAVIVPWGTVPTDRAAVRAEVVQMHDEARAVLGESQFPVGER